MSYTKYVVPWSTLNAELAYDSFLDSAGLNLSHEKISSSASD